ncbi:unnamed protein product [Caenorhabditis bovis]|uniref:C-type lectin domain-containing protein n=1 Tax=Caenorhabditis bovis TaxID=2654633 RepID=A0A8S1EWI4_9PELO|nr:unnamed protein product [Caenorhabditis bovis]
MRFSYYITVTAGIVNFAFTEEELCEDGWTRRERAVGRVCIKVVVEPKPIEFADAQNRCISENAHLAGIESNDEREFITQEAMLKISNLTKDTIGVWVAGVRRDNCRGSDWMNHPGCAEQSFEWIDPLVTGTNRFIFVESRPDGVMRDDIQQDCLFLTIFPSIHGLLDDQFCITQCYNLEMMCYVYIVSYVCVKMAGQI